MLGMCNCAMRGLLYLLLTPFKHSHGNASCGILSACAVCKCDVPLRCIALAAVLLRESWDEALRASTEMLGGAAAVAVQPRGRTDRVIFVTLNQQPTSDGRVLKC